MRFWSAMLAIGFVAFGVAGCGGSSTSDPSTRTAEVGSSNASGSDASATARALANTLLTLPPATTRQINALLGGIPQTGTFLGSPSAPITLQYFIDVGCPAAREITMGPLASIIRTWVRPGRLRLEFRSIEEGSEPPTVFVPQQVAALAAGTQDRLWDYLEYSYRAVEKLGSNYSDTCSPPFEGFPQVVARLVPGLQLSRWNEARQTQNLANEVTTSERMAARADMGHEYRRLAPLRPYYPDPGYLIGRTGAADAVTLLRFSQIDPAYDEVIRRLSSVKVQGG
jgi:hypothetical protein